jgi:DNA repair protein RadC
VKELLSNIVNEKSLNYITEHYPSLRHLCNATEKELLDIPYVGKAKARELKSILDLSKQLLLPEKSSVYIKSPSDIYDYLKVMSLYEEEQLVGVYLDIKNKIIDSICVSKGSINSSIVHPREVFAPAIRLKVSSVIVCHNHPSGDPTPSQEDINVTKRLYEAGKIIGIDLIDHVIIANGYTSLKEKGLM